MSSWRFLIGSGCGDKLTGKKDFLPKADTHIVKDGFHKCDSDLCLLHEIVLSVLDI
jgi:hypothetical protein